MSAEIDRAYDDLFRDPIVAMVMASDRIAAEDARRLFVEVAERIRMRRREQTADHSLSERATQDAVRAA